MGDVAWLTGSLTAAAGLITYLVRWILNRERELRQGLQAEVARERQISSDWKTAHDTRAANDERRDALIWQMLDNQRYLAWGMERLLAATVTADGGPGSSDYDATRTRPPPRHEQR